METATTEQCHIGTIRRPMCYVCGAAGDPLYQRLCDRLFGVQGEWNLRRCSNQQCRLVWLDPMPAVSELGKLYRTYHTHEYTDTAAAPLPVKLVERFRDAYCTARYGPRDRWRWTDPAVRAVAFLMPGLRAMCDVSVFYLPAQAGGRLLDVGCGNGRTMRRLAALGWQVHGIDFDPKAVEVARSQGLDALLGTIEDQDFEDACFDAVVVSHVIEHVPDPRALLAGCRRVLKPGGQLVLITPNASSWGHDMYGRCWRGLEPPRHLHIFTPQAMVMLADELSFSRSRISSIAANAHAVLWLSRQLQQTGDVGHYDFSLRSGLWGGAMQIAEMMRLVWCPHAGEELVLQAYK